MRRTLLAVCLAAASAGLFAQSIAELFGTAKEQIKAGSWADASKTLDALDAESAKPGQESIRKQLEGPLAFYRGVCDANLGKTNEAVERFGAFLKLQPNASIDAAVYSKKAVAAFEKAQKAAASDPDRAPSFANAYKAFQPAPGTAEVVDQFWGDGPVKWIMTDGEKKTWASLADGNARADFVEKFWEARKALPQIDGRTYRAEFERRAAFADANLALVAEQRGSLTDRGMVFVLLGPPTYAARRPLRTGDDQSTSDGLSTVGSQDTRNAMRAGSGTSTSSAKAGRRRLRILRPREDRARLVQQHGRDLGLPQGAAAGEHPVPAGRLQVPHEAGLRRQRSPARVGHRHRHRGREAPHPDVVARRPPQAFCASM